MHLFLYKAYRKKTFCGPDRGIHAPSHYNTSAIRSVSYHELILGDIYNSCIEMLTDVKTFSCTKFRTYTYFWTVLSLSLSGVTIVHFYR